MSITTPPTPTTNDQIEAVLHQGLLDDRPDGVRAIREALGLARAVTTALCEDPSPAAAAFEVRTEPIDAPVIPEQRTAPRCGHTDPIKGPCRRRPHSNAPRAHDYTHEVVSTGPQHFSDPLPA